MAIIKTSKNKIKSQKALYNAIKYISNTAKTAVISMGDGSIFTTANDVADTFQMVRNIHNKNDGRLAHHFIFSFPPSEKIDSEKAHKIALQLVKQAFPNYESVVAIHNDCKHLHAHIILNAVNTKTGMKYCDNKSTLYYLRNLSNEICKRYGLRVLPKLSGKEGIDQATMHAKNSWKKNLLKVLDKAILNCKSRTEFMNFVNKNGYECRYTGANITITKEGQKKGIRVDTLAQQFNNTKYTKLNLEKAKGFWERPKEFIRIEHKKKNVNVRFESEFQRFEKYLFEQINKHEVVETEKSVLNFSLKEILESQGKNFKGEIDLLELVKLKELDSLFYAEKFKDTAVVVIKDYNTEKLKSQVNILTKADKILLQHKNQNKKIYAEICATAERNNEKPCYRVVNEIQFNRLKNSNLKFAYFQKGENYNVVFNKKDEETFSYALKAKGLQF